MKIYKVPTRLDPNEGMGDDHTGYYFTSSKRDANNVFKIQGAQPELNDQIEELELAMNKHDIIRFLNVHCSHPDNG